MTEYTPAFPGLAFPGLTWPSLGAPPVMPDVYAGLAPRSLDELLAGSHTRLAAAHILTGPQAGAVLPIVAAPLTLVEDGPVRLSGSLTVAAVAPWTEQTAAAALDPRSGVEIALAQGALGDDGTEHWWPVGVVRPTTHAVTRTAARIEVSMTVTDRGGILAGAGADRATIIPVGDGLAFGVMAALVERAPWLPVDLPDDEATVAVADIVLAERAGDDLWGACRDVMRSIGRNLHVNADGVAVAPLRAQSRFTEPLDVPLVGASVETDIERVVHRVEAIYQYIDESYQLASESVYAVDEEAVAALPAHVPVRTVRFSGDESLLFDAQQAFMAASAELSALQDQVASGSCQSIPHPDIVPGAVLDPFDDGERYRITSMSLDLAGGPVDIALGNTSRTYTARLKERLEALASAMTGERVEYVVTLDPLTTRPLYDPGAPALTAEDYVGGLLQNEIVRVLHSGRAHRAVVGRWTSPS